MKNHPGSVFVFILSFSFFLHCERASIKGSCASLCWAGATSPYTFATQSISNASTTTLTIRNDGQTKARVLSTSFDHSSFSYVDGTYPGTGGTCASHILANSSCTIKLAFTPSLGGTASGNWTMNYDSGSGERTLTLAVSGLGVGQGSLDTEFGTNGIVSLDYQQNEEAKAVLIRDDGKIVVLLEGDDGGAASHTMSLVRLNPSGSLDTVFGTSGRVVVASGANLTSVVGNIAQQSDGKLVVGGTQSYLAAEHIFTVRVTADGVVDTSYGVLGTSILATVAGSIDDSAGALALNSLGGVTLFGEGSVLLSTSDTFGVLVDSLGLVGLGAMFVGSAGNDERVTSVAVQADGNFVVGGSSGAGAGTDSVLMRASQATLTLDNTFGASGVVAGDLCGTGNFDEIKSVDIYSDGRITAAGVCTSGASAKDVFIRRYNSTGSDDTSFNGTGLVEIDVNSANRDDQGLSLKVLSSGKVLVGGSVDVGTHIESLLLKLKTNGSFETAFGVSGIVETDASPGGDNWINAIATQSDGKIVAVGVSTGATQNISVIRYFP